MIGAASKNAVGALLVLLAGASACGSTLSKTEIPDAVESDAALPVAPQPEIRFVTDGQTLLSRGAGQATQVVINSSYAGLRVLTRAWLNNPWDLYDPISQQHMATFRGAGNPHGLFAVDGDKLIEVVLDTLPSV